MTNNQRPATSDRTNRSRPATNESGASRRLREAVRSLALAHRATNAEPMQAMSATAFRSVVAERLRALERDVAEVRSRINGLLFVVVGAVIAQLILRLFG